MIGVWQTGIAYATGDEVLFTGAGWFYPFFAAYLGRAAGIGIIAMLQAYVFPGMIPIPPLGK